MAKEFMRIFHFSGKIFGHTKTVFTNFDGEESFIESYAFLGFSLYKVSQNNLATISDFMSRGRGVVDDKMVSLQKRVELEKDEEYQRLKSDYRKLGEIKSGMSQKISKLSSALLNLKYSARTVIEDFDDMELEELK